MRIQAKLNKAEGFNYTSLLSVFVKNQSEHRRNLQPIPILSERSEFIGMGCRIRF